MANRFEQAVARLSARLKSRVGVQVVYHRGEDSTVITAIVGQTVYKTNEIDGSSRLEWTARDYLISVDELEINGVRVLPQEHDWLEIVAPAPDTKQRWEVLPVNDEPAWRYSDDQRTQYRIHTKPFSVV